MSIDRVALERKTAEAENKRKHIEQRMQEIQKDNMALVPEIKKYILEFLKEKSGYMFQHIEILQEFEWEGAIRKQHYIHLWDSREGILLWESSTYANVVDLMKECIGKAMIELIAEGEIETMKLGKDLYYGLKR